MNLQQLILQQFEFEMQEENPSDQEQTPYAEMGQMQTNQQLQNDPIGESPEGLNEHQMQRQGSHEHNGLNFHPHMNQQSSHTDELVNGQEDKIQPPVYQKGDNMGYYHQMMVPQQQHPQSIPRVKREVYRGVTQDQQKMIIRKAMTLDRQDRKKTEQQLKLEVDELKKMKNTDEADIKMLKVELNKLEMVYKKFKEQGSFQSSIDNTIIQLPERFINKMNMRNDPDANDYQSQNGIAETQQLLDDINFVRNQLQCELIKIKNNEKGSDNFFKARNSGAESNQLKSLQSYNDKNLLNFVGSNNSFQNLSGHSQSQVRVQINNLKTKCKLLQDQIKKKEEEIEKLGHQTRGPSGDEKTKNELKRAHNILKQLNKRLKNGGGYGQGKNPLQQEYETVMGQLQDVLQINPRKATESGQQPGLKNEMENDMQDVIQNTHGSQQNEGDEQEENNLAEAENEAEENEEHLADLRQKISDLKHELEMSPRQFEDKLLHKLREEILTSKQRMQAQIQSEMNQERERMEKITNKVSCNQANNLQNQRKEELTNQKKYLGGEVKRLKGAIKKGQASLPANMNRK